MNILAIGAHFDDVELGCGGALAKHAKAGDNIIIYTATDSSWSNESGQLLRAGDVALKEAYKSAELLNAKLVCGGFRVFEIEFNDTLNRDILNIINEYNVDLIYTHWDKDVHHDHTILAQSTLHCAKNVDRILMYQSNWHQGTKGFECNFFVDISEFWNEKERLISCYKGELERVSGKWIEYFKSLASVTGVKVGVKYAEGFQLVRWLT